MIEFEEMRQLFCGAYHGLRERLVAAADDWLGKKGEFLPYPWMHQLCQLVVDRFDSGDYEQSEALFLVVEKLLATGEEAVKTAVATGFLEGLQHQRKITSKLWRPLLGPLAESHCVVMDKFHGVTANRNRIRPKTEDRRTTASTNMQTDNILLKTERLTLTPLCVDDAKSLLDYYERNRLNFRPWEPKRDDSFFTVQSMRDRVSAASERMINQQSLHFVLRELDSAEIIGECGFTNIVRGPFQACHLGFSICKRHEGQGVMYEALRCAIDFIFRELALHRVMANYRPENNRSHQLLRRLGFEQEGRARSYLKIDGEWRDHILTSLINETFS